MKFPVPNSALVYTANIVSGCYCRANSVGRIDYIKLNMWVQLIIEPNLWIELIIESTLLRELITDPNSKFPVAYKILSNILEHF